MAFLDAAGFSEMADEASTAASAGGPPAAGDGGAGLQMASGGLQAVGGLLKGITSLISGQAQAKAYKEEARQAEREAGVNSSIALQQGDRTVAAGAVQAAANGGGLGGSSMGVLQDLSNQAMFRARQIVYGGNATANADMYRAHVAQRNGVIGLLSNVVGSSASILSSASSAAAESQAAQARSYLYGYGGPAGGLPDSGYGYTG